MPQQQQEGNDFKRNFNIAFSFLVMHQRALTIPMRNRYGLQALGVPCALAVVLMALWAAFSYDPFMWLWLGIWLLFFVKRRLESLRLNWNGVRVHSQYDGFPFDAIRLGRTENVAKLVVEPILIGILGSLVYWLYAQAHMSPYGLPYFLLAGVFTLPFVEMAKQTIWQKRTQAMLDARLEQEQTMRSFRSKFGGN